MCTALATSWRNITRDALRLATPAISLPIVSAVNSPVLAASDNARGLSAPGVSASGASVAANGASVAANGASVAANGASVAANGAPALDAPATDEQETEVYDEENDIPSSSTVDPARQQFLQTLQRAKEGDLKAFEEIFQLYHRRIYNAVYGMLGDPDDAQDVTQDVFLRLHDALPTLRADEAFSTYLYRIALNLCRDRARRKKRVRFQSIDTPRTDDDGDSESMEFPDQGKLPEETLTNDELQKRVREAVGTLSPDHRAVIVMHHFQGKEVNEIADLLKVPTGTVKSRLARGRDQLHRKLRGYLNV